MPRGRPRKPRMEVLAETGVGMKTEEWALEPIVDGAEGGESDEPSITIQNHQTKADTEERTGAIEFRHGHPQRAMAKANEAPEYDYGAIEKVLAMGDVGQLDEKGRVEYLMGLCRVLKLNPLTKPFDFIPLNGKITCYTTRNCTDQLRKVHRVNLTILEREFPLPGIYSVKAHAAMPDGRTDESVGIVSILNLQGSDLANALMRAETKAKRRATLSILGLSFIDESELDTINYVKPNDPSPRQITPQSHPRPQQAPSFYPNPDGYSLHAHLPPVQLQPPTSPATPPTSSYPAPLPPAIPGGPLPPPRPPTPAPIQEAQPPAPSQPPHNGGSKLGLVRPSRGLVRPSRPGHR